MWEADNSVINKNKLGKKTFTDSVKKTTLIRIERMKRVFDAGKRCDSEGLQLSFLTYRIVSLLVLSFWVTDLTRTHAGFLSGAPRLGFYFGGVVHKIFGLGN